MARVSYVWDVEGDRLDQLPGHSLSYQTDLQGANVAWLERRFAAMSGRMSVTKQPRSEINGLEVHDRIVTNQI